MRAGTPRGYVFTRGDHIGYKKDTKSKYVCHPDMLHRNIYDYVCQAAGVLTLLHRVSTRTRGRVTGISHPSQIFCVAEQPKQLLYMPRFSRGRPLLLDDDLYRIGNRTTHNPGEWDPKGGGSRP